MTMDENDALGFRIMVTNKTDTNRCPDMSTLPTVVPDDVEALDIKPELLDLSESKPGHQATKASQTEITLCDEFWNVCIC